VPEPGAAEVAAIWLGAEGRVSSIVLYPEARAAIGRAQRMGRLPRASLARARRRFEALWDAIDWIELTIDLAGRAGDLAEHHGLRAYDAVHLASLEHVSDRDTALVSADEQLLVAARSMGLTTAPVA
jgi:hypothetical protein